MGFDCGVTTVHIAELIVEHTAEVEPRNPG